MTSVVVDISQESLDEVQRVANDNYRSRKAQLELIIEWWVRKEKEKK
jgi:hypothetical protein